jgi:hypothetical protein
VTMSKRCRFAAHLQKGVRTPDDRRADFVMILAFRHCERKRIPRLCRSFAGSNPSLRISNSVSSSRRPRPRTFRVPDRVNQGLY